MPKDRQELVILAGGIAVLLLVWIFLALAGEVGEGDTRKFDEWLILALRQPGDPGQLRGGRWLQAAAEDLTALGGPTVLGLTVLTVTGYLVLSGLRRTGLFVFVAATGGWVLNWSLKAAFARPRPDIVPHLREVMSTSFPSGHALTSAAVFLTLGALLMRIAEGRAVKFYCMAVAMTVTLLVGASRVLLGVHYPSDVLAGWTVGLCWALLCWLVGRVLERRAGLRREQDVHRGAG
jgi:undecaprenyl-diphosphatase